MQEKDLNRIINKTFAERGFSHKLQDPPQAVAKTFGKNPFDGFAMVDGVPIYWEAKLNKGYSALSFSKIQEHQLDSLLTLGDSGFAFPLIMWGIYEPRKVKHIYTFDIDFISSLIQQGKKSITKKELLEFHEKNMYVEIKKEYFDIDQFWHRIIHGRENTTKD
jgi:penicillin-binding protein-related factor A (putative recombinase)